jgi:antirestriction protein ArdC
MRDGYQAITDQVVRAMDAGVVPWRKPWRGGDLAPRSLRTGKPYRGINAAMLQIQTALLGYDSAYWCTFRQASALGLRVAKGAKGTAIIFWKREDEPRQEDSISVGEARDAPVSAVPPRATIKPRMFANAYVVFSLDQTDLAAQLAAGTKTCGKDGIPADAFPVAKPAASSFLSVEAADYIMEHMPNPPTVSVGQSERAFYVPALDLVRLPAQEQFDAPDEFYGTAFHELGHRTGHQSRLNRPGLMTFDHFGSDRYGREELVAEFTAAYLGAEAGIARALIENSAAYLRSWRGKIAADKRLVVIAAGQAQRAADCILGRAAAGPPGTDGEETSDGAAARTSAAKSVATAPTFPRPS